MEINNDLYKQLMNCPWLENCGVPQQELFSFPVAWVDKSSIAIKNISSVRWENICLKEQNNLSEFLALNHKTEYNKNWNKVVDLLKSQYLCNILPCIESVCQKKNMPDDILNDISFNLLSIFLMDYFSEYYTVDFFDTLLKIYLSGHLPCGWKGSHPEGAIMIF